MRCPACNKDEKVMRVGIRKFDKGKVQKYFCRGCGRHFCSSIHPFSRYPDRIIARSLELYNRGEDIDGISSILERECEDKVPKRTIYSWLERYDKVFGLYLLRGSRKGGNISPLVECETGFDCRYPLRYHRRKVNETKRTIPELASYLDRIENGTDDIVLEGEQLTDGQDTSILGFRETGANHCITLQDLYEEVHGKRRKGRMMEYFLLNHPHVLMSSLPLYMKKDELDGSHHFKGIADMVSFDGERLGIIQVVRNNTRPENVAFEAGMIWKAFEKRIGHNNSRLSLLYQDRLLEAKHE